MYLTIDPGITGTGWAAWPGIAVMCVRAKLPSDYGVIIPRGKTFDEKMAFLAVAFSVLLTDHTPNAVYCEYPSLFTGSEAGLSCASSGSLVKLACVVGLIWGAAAGRQIPFHRVPVNEWKGQLPKPVVARRIKKLLGADYPDHAADAVGIGLYLQGRF